MSGYGIPDALGPLEVSEGNAAAIPLRQRVRVFGPLTLLDEPEQSRSVLVGTALPYRAVSVAGDAFWGEHEQDFAVPAVAGLSAADLVRLDPGDAGDRTIEGLKDAAHPTRAPWKPVKYLANVSVSDVLLRAATDLTDNPAPFLNTLLLEAGSCVRVVWDSETNGWRCRGGAVTWGYLTLDGDHLTLDGDRIVVI